MIYSFTWLVLVITSLCISLLAFGWALRNGQFSEQARLRYLPLRDQPAVVAPADRPGKPGMGAYALLAVLIAGLLVILAPVVLTFWNVN